MLSRSPVAWRVVGGIALFSTAVLLALSSRYDYHRDELYFRQLGGHPAWGYIDQPPLTPLIARAAIELFGDTVWAIRVPAALMVGCTAVVAALIAREVGGAAAAQALAAVGVLSPFPLIAGHTLVTATPDLLVWALVVLFVLRALLRAGDTEEERRHWLWAGVVVGVGLYNKLLVVLLLVGLAIGLMLVGPRHVLRSRWVWAGVGLAVLIGLPNLIYQLTHGLPQLDMAAALAQHKGDDARPQFVPMQFILLGPPLVPIWIAGMVTLLRRPELRPARALAVAYPAICVLLIVIAGQPYYTLGLLLGLYAIGATATVRWLAWGRVPARRLLLGAGLALNIAIAAVIALPVLSVPTLADTPLPDVNQVIRDSIGWPAYVAQIAAAYRALPPADAANAVIITGNYGEAGAVERYGPRLGLPAVYSGQNQLWYLARPPETAEVAIVVLEGQPDEFLSRMFTRCEVVGTLDNGVGIDNEEQGAGIRVCRGPRDSWRALWPSFAHLD